MSMTNMSLHSKQHWVNLVSEVHWSVNLPLRAFVNAQRLTEHLSHVFIALMPLRQ